MKNLLKILFNVIVFIILRYLVILYYIIKDIGPNDEYSIWDYFPVLFIQIIVIVIIMFKNAKDGKPKEITLNTVIIIILILLFLGRHFNLIPHIIVPA